MSKKINNKTIDATTNTEVKTTQTAADRRNIAAGEDLKALFEKYPNASLRKLAIATDSTYGLMLKYSKQPITGEAYDPEATNWTAVANYLIKRGVDLATIDWDALNESTTRAAGKIVKDMSKFEVGQKVYLRKYPTTPYEIVYKTETHIVIMLEGTSEPQAWANNTFLLNGPQFEPRAEHKDTAEVEDNSSKEVEEVEAAG